jgi:threonine synthase
MTYRSTRGSGEYVTATQAILQGLAADGGLFVSEAVPSLEIELAKLAQLSYREVAYAVMKPYLLGDIAEEELKSCIALAYDEKFDTPAIAPLRSFGNTCYLELYHGATLAFKDMALAILPHFMRVAAKKQGLAKEIVILTATSGDTGKAALAGFADVPGFRVIVFYPQGGVSPIQERQMVTQKGENTLVVSVKGNFDDAQTGVKQIFADREMQAVLERKGYVLSSANSINIGRLLPQIAYYYYAYGRLLKEGRIRAGETINVAVPTGNFGNILAAYYAKRMGLPLERLICASNENKVLYDFLLSGTYDRNRDFYLTSSPSMDILVSSNLERLIFHSAGDDPERCGELMAGLRDKGHYEITDVMREYIGDFYGGYATEAETTAAIARVYREHGYVIDPHTAVAASVYEKYRRESGDDKITVVISTASPYKFPRSVVTAIDGGASGDDFAIVERLHDIIGGTVPSAVEEARTAPVCHRHHCEVADMAQVVKGYLEI